MTVSVVKLVNSIIAGINSKLGVIKAKNKIIFYFNAFMINEMFRLITFYFFIMKKSNYSVSTKPSFSACTTMFFSRPASTALATASQYKVTARIASSLPGTM